MSEFPDQLIVNDNHTSGALMIPWTQARYYYYGGGGVPKVRIDGLAEIVGNFGSPEANANQYRIAINQRLAQTGGVSPVLIEGAHQVGPTHITMAVRFTLDEPVAIADPRVVLQILEDNVPVYFYDHIVRAAYEQPVTLVNQGDYVDVSYDFPATAVSNLDNMETIAFLFSYPTKEVVQAARILPVADFDFTFDSPILSLPQGNGLAEFAGTLVNISDQADVLTVELDNTFGWPAEFKVEGEPAFHTTPSTVPLASAEEIRIYLNVQTDGDVRIGEGTLDITSANTDRTQYNLARVFNGSPSIFFVEDDGVRPNELSVLAALDSGNFLYDHWSVYAAGGSPAFDNMNGYDIVIWHNGYEAGGMTTLEEESMLSYLDSGGGLLLSSQEYLSYPSGAELRERLGVGSYASNVGDISQVIGVPGDPLGDGMDYDLYYFYAYWNRPDDVTTNSNGVVFLRTDGGHGVGVRAETRAGRSLFYSFCINELDESSQSGPWPDTEDLIMRSIDWLAMGDPQAIDDLPPVDMTSRIERVGPNPFTLARSHGAAAIHLTVSARAAQSPAKLEVVDINGRVVRSLAGQLQAGSQSINWDGCDSDGRPVGAGMYYVRLATAEGSAAKRMVVMQ